MEPQEKSSRLIDVIKNSIPSDREWTVDEIISTVKDNGLNAEKKEIYNVIGYLNRKNLIKRVGYGRYTIYGVEIVTSEDFGGEDTRHEDEYRTARESPK
jgi:Fe2+ or Zn2+ uptake regulation protein